MLRRILVLLGETQSSLAAQQYAISLATKADASVTGIVGVDLRHINSSTLGGIGTTSHKLKSEKEWRCQAADICKKSQDSFQSECKAQGLRFEWQSFEGDPTKVLYSKAESHDVVVTGHDTAFRGRLHEQLSDTASALLSKIPRPLIVCSDGLAAWDHTLVAYDGSLPAMRAIQMFAFLGLGRDKPIQITSIDRRKELASRRIEGAAIFLRAHGYRVDGNPVASRDRPIGALKSAVAEQQIGTLVMGAYGHHGLRRLVCGSTTRALVENPPCVLFVYH